jgi:hypothetical protein
MQVRAMALHVQTSAQAPHAPAQVQEAQELSARLEPARAVPGSLGLGPVVLLRRRRTRRGR